MRRREGIGNRRIALVEHGQGIVDQAPVGRKHHIALGQGQGHREIARRGKLRRIGRLRALLSAGTGAYRARPQDCSAGQFPRFHGHSARAGLTGPIRVVALRLVRSRFESANGVTEGTGQGAFDASQLRGILGGFRVEPGDEHWGNQGRLGIPAHANRARHLFPEHFCGGLSAVAQFVHHIGRIVPVHRQARAGCRVHRQDTPHLTTVPVLRQMRGIDHPLGGLGEHLAAHDVVVFARPHMGQDGLAAGQGHGRHLGLGHDDGRRGLGRSFGQPGPQVHHGLVGDGEYLASQVAVLGLAEAGLQVESLDEEGRAYRIEHDRSTAKSPSPPIGLLTERSSASSKIFGT